jgi:hypothetical protein
MPETLVFFKSFQDSELATSEFDFLNIFIVRLTLWISIYFMKINEAKLLPSLIKSSIFRLVLMIF